MCGAYLRSGKQGLPLPSKELLFHLILNLSVVIVRCFVVESSMLHQLTQWYIRNSVLHILQLWLQVLLLPAIRVSIAIFTIYEVMTADTPSVPLFIQI